MTETRTEFYKRIGAIGGKKKVPKGFAKMDIDKQREASAKGGKVSRRGKSK
jgi:general stress protein YciG